MYEEADSEGVRFYLILRMQDSLPSYADRLWVRQMAHDTHGTPLTPESWDTVQSR